MRARGGRDNESPEQRHTSPGRRSRLRQRPKQTVRALARKRGRGARASGAIPWPSRETPEAVGIACHIARSGSLRRAFWFRLTKEGSPGKMTFLSLLKIGLSKVTWTTTPNKAMIGIVITMKAIGCVPIG